MRAPCAAQVRVQLLQGLWAAPGRSVRVSSGPGGPRAARPEPRFRGAAVQRRRAVGAWHAQLRGRRGAGRARRLLSPPRRVRCKLEIPVPCGVGGELSTCTARVSSRAHLGPLGLGSNLFSACACRRAPPRYGDQLGGSVHEAEGGEGGSLVGGGGAAGEGVHLPGAKPLPSAEAEAPDVPLSRATVCSVPLSLSLPLSPPLSLCILA